ncbi:TPA: alpha/beta hydrolase, partial [Escherichia coli]
EHKTLSISWSHYQPEPVKQALDKLIPFYKTHL